MQTPALYTLYSEELSKEVRLRWGVKADNTCFHDVLEKKYHVPELPIEPRTVLDLGSNIGLTMMHYQSIWPAAHIYGYEMDSENHWVSQFNYRGDMTYNEAIWTYNGHVPYIKGRDSEQCYKITYRSTHPVDGSAKAVTLDTALNRINTADGVVDFVKMDIEGAEFSVLASPGTWHHRIRFLLVEVHGIVDSDTPRNVEIVKNILGHKGFTVERHSPHWSALLAWRKHDR